MPQAKSIKELCEERYSRPEVAAAVMDHAAELGTTAAIELGERTLPSEADANHWHDRVHKDKPKQETPKRKR